MGPAVEPREPAGEHRPASRGLELWRGSTHDDTRPKRGHRRRRRRPAFGDVEDELARLDQVLRDLEHSEGVAVTMIQCPSPARERRLLHDEVEALWWQG